MRAGLGSVLGPRPETADLLRDLSGELRSMKAVLSQFVTRQAAILEGEIFEELAFGPLVATNPSPQGAPVSSVPPAAGATITDVFPAQTSSVEIITGILVVTQVLTGPTTASGVVLTLGEHRIPIQNSTELLCPVLFKTHDQTRQLQATYGAAAWTQGAYVAVWGFAAAATNPPGRVH
jgi:hypothetical protein